MSNPVVKLTTINPFPAEMSGETYTFAVDGKEVAVESWATHNSGGREFYDGEGASIEKDLPEELQNLLSEAFDTIGDVFYGKWSEYVQPAIDRAIAETVEQVNNDPDGFFKFEEEEA